LAVAIEKDVSIMAKHKIPKNRSIEDMFQGVQEEETFETMDWDDESDQTNRMVKKPAKQQTASDFRKQFFSDDLQEKVGRILLEIKMDYYKDGVGDISMQVVKDGRNVVIKTAPKMSKKNRD
jgi:hypothetical protein